MIDRYLRWKAGSASRNTAKTYTDALRLFSQWLSMAGIDGFTETADALPSSVMEEYIVWMRKRPSIRTGRPLAAQSVALYHAAVVDLFKYAARRKWLPDRFKWAEMKADAAETLGKVPKRSAQFDPRIPLLVLYVDKLPLPAPTAPRGCTVNCGPSRSGQVCAHQARAASRAQQGYLALLRDRALMHLMLSSGMRKAEVASLNRTHVERTSDNSAVIVGKGAKERRVFWDADTRQAVNTWLTARDDDYLPLFIRLDNHRRDPGPRGEHWRLSGQNIWAVVQGYARPFGIEATPHAFRHAMASAMLENDAPLSLIQELLGHSSPTVTRQVYAAYEQKSLRKGFDKYNPSASEQAMKLRGELDRQHRGQP